MTTALQHGHNRVAQREAWWRWQTSMEDKCVSAVRRSLANRLSWEEEQQILVVCNQSDDANLSPSQIVLALADTSPLPLGFCGRTPTENVERNFSVFQFFGSRKDRHKILTIRNKRILYGFGQFEWISECEQALSWATLFAAMMRVWGAVYRNWKAVNPARALKFRFKWSWL